MVWNGGGVVWDGEGVVWDGGRCGVGWGEVCRGYSANRTWLGVKAAPFKAAEKLSKIYALEKSNFLICW